MKVKFIKKYGEPKIHELKNVSSLTIGQKILTNYKYMGMVFTTMYRVIAIDPAYATAKQVDWKK